MKNARASVPSSINNMNIICIIIIINIIIIIHIINMLIKKN